MQEITRQSDQFGLPEKTASEVPDPKEVEAQLKAAAPWSGPQKPDIE
jgi:hypothetical protein